MYNIVQSTMVGSYCTAIGGRGYIILACSLIGMHKHTHYSKLHISCNTSCPHVKQYTLKTSTDALISQLKILICTLENVFSAAYKEIKERGSFGSAQSPSNISQVYPKDFHFLRVSLFYFLYLKQFNQFYFFFIYFFFNRPSSQLEVPSQLSDKNKKDRQHIFNVCCS